MVAREALHIELMRVIDRVPAENLGILEKLLTEGKGGTMFACLNFEPISEEAARDAVTAAIEEAEHYERITQHRKILHECIEDAQKRIAMAGRELRTLGELYDVEYEGGSADLEAFLADAGRALRAAQALKPTDKDGEVT